MDNDTRGVYLPFVKTPGRSPRSTVAPGVFDAMPWRHPWLILNTKFRLAFISYGPANTYPSPIIAKRFFSALQVITKELRDEQQKLGIGQTSSGGSGGMAALEGLVAAIEVSVHP